MITYIQSKIGYWIIGCISVGVFILIGILIYLNLSPSYANKTSREIVQLCTPDMATEFHIHPHLDIVINGQKQVIPADIGVESSCDHPIHTHDDSGTIHVESPVMKDFTLADFFFVWNKTFSKDQILDTKVDENHIIKETINGQESQDYENTVLHDKDQIIILYELKK